MNEQLQRVIEPVVKELGCELWGIELGGVGRNALLKVFIDSKAGIDADDCERVSRQLSSVLDVEDPLPGHYTLEVSSPGMDRRLFYPSQYEEFIGAQVRIMLRHPLNGRRKFTGQLCVSDGTLIKILVGDAEYALPFEEIERANIVPEF